MFALLRVSFYIFHTQIMAQKKTALILVDIQNDFLENGSLAVSESSDILNHVNELITKVKCKQGLIIATQV